MTRSESDTSSYKPGILMRWTATPNGLVADWQALTQGRRTANWATRASTRPVKLPPTARMVVAQRMSALLSGLAVAFGTTPAAPGDDGDPGWGVAKSIGRGL